MARWELLHSFKCCDVSGGELDVYDNQGVISFESESCSDETVSIYLSAKDEVILLGLLNKRNKEQ
jgi:hypothetical protein